MMMNKKKPFSLHLDVDSFMPATAEEKEVISRMRPSSTFFRDGVKRLLKNKVATISLILIVLITLSSIIIPMFWPYSYDQMLGQTKGRPMDNSYNNLAPFQYGKTELKKIDKGESVFPHIFGTDAHGRDYFIRVVYGTRISLAVGFFASIIVLVIGMMIGAVAGYFGGRVDLFIMRIVDIIYSLPDMLVIILLAVVLGQVLHVEGTILEKIGSNIISMFIVFGLLYWVGMARLIRGQILSLREQEYVLSAQATGAKAQWIIRKHLLPNCISVFNVIVLRSFFYSVPDSLREAAEIDGAGPIRTLVTVYLPLSLPSLATLALFYAVGRWNGFSDALMYLKSSKAEKYWPIQLLLYNIIKNSTQSGEIATQEGFFSAGVSKTIQMASVMFATVPILLVYPWLQRYFVTGVTIGAVKG